MSVLLIIEKKGESNRYVGPFDGAKQMYEWVTSLPFDPEQIYAMVPLEVPENIGHG